MKVSPMSEPLRVSETAPRSVDTPSPPPKEEAPPPPVGTALASMTQSSAAVDQADHAARLKGVAMALQSGRYSLDLMRIAEALMRQ
jgi:hypothetical protein